MRVWELQDNWGIDHLKLLDRPEPGPPGPGQVAVRLRAASLNYRDLSTLGGGGREPDGVRLIPLSDAAGDVIAVGEGVTRVKVGDRVCPTFFQEWFTGSPTARNRARSLGSLVEPGVAQDVVVLSQDGVTAIPDHMSYLEAATLPCAALTAWRAVKVETDVQAGKSVLLEGTGGVSIFALQFAKAFGATTIITSSSDEKLERAKSLGADHLINYRETPDWGRKARELAGGLGVDCVVEVGGAGTIEQAVAAAAVGGDVMVIGSLGGASQITLPQLIGKNLHVHGISVGSRTMFEAMSAAMSEHQIGPVIDKVYAFAELPDALRAMKAGEHFGKICIDYAQ
ncbi:NAD(P)-dependent alcohol dehydrogenase [Phenylobacterium sp.]|uniref:zinc-dependent alcohol dehydrogenase family protein n=1 Tax=Phenylobacterium sp. TaxID=1871053 RepID=UPI0027358E79|nr:NAD(P)-dependent alcohol dehydrogenase [Phenylobacterium sp.]MDP3660280.1 NAD(P)-dependent alcohol dehydrogenase [Phenylobacterium sp.]